MSDAHLLTFDRYGRITASIVGAITRTDPYHSRKWAWRVCMGTEPEHDPGKDARRGIEHEDDALVQAEVETGFFVEKGYFVPHPEITWLGASPDGFIWDGKLHCCIPVECKCPRNLYTGIPAHYYDQVQTQIECVNAPYAYFVQWVGDSQRVERVERNAEWRSLTRPILTEFYESYVATGVEPPRSPRRGKNGVSDGNEGKVL